MHHGFQVAIVCNTSTPDMECVSAGLDVNSIHDLDEGMCIQRGFDGFEEGTHLQEPGLIQPEDYGKWFQATPVMIIELKNAIYENIQLTDDSKHACYGKCIEQK